MKPLAKPIVAIIGRRNVGKSTLLNRIAGKQIAIVEDMPGTTRDRVFADATWNGIDFLLVDTGGLEFQGESTIEQEVRKQAEIAIQEADAIIFLTDAKQGLMPDDEMIADILRKTSKPIFLAVNKVDSAKQAPEAAEFFKLGFGEPALISAYHGRGVADLLDKVVASLPPPTPEPETPVEGIKVAIVGRPHVGKSLLLNTLVGKQRAIVGTQPGTTRDAIDTVLDFGGQNVILIDTAGIRRRGRIESGIELYSVVRAMRAIDRSDIALLVVDATEPLTAQDAHIAGHIEKAGKGIIVLVNKWDLIKEKDPQSYEEYIKNRLKFAPYVPVLFISAKTGQGVKKIMPLVQQISMERSMRIPDAEVNELIKTAVETHNLPRKGRKILEYYSARQTGINPPTFQVEVNDARLIHFSYERFLENRLREVYGFRGTPIRLVFKSRG
ncbi:MAG: ribosome biogenesis GTPase Der [Dehalococcoidales bacterium]|jgi:GTP-binding protein|nr:ribosome biogenesis GTPase Der [Dehalococcoidales bacterium]